MKASDIMTDEDVAKVLRISKDAFQRRCRKGFREGEIDMLAAAPVVVGGMRRWFRADVERVLAERPRVGGASRPAERAGARLEGAAVESRPAGVMARGVRGWGRRVAEEEGGAE